LLPSFLFLSYFDVPAPSRRLRTQTIAAGLWDVLHTLTPNGGRRRDYNVNYFDASHSGKLPQKRVLNLEMTEVRVVLSWPVARKETTGRGTEGVARTC
jgi:hypothetical protein